MVRRGYITHAINTSTVDYIRMAYALALSIRRTQSEVAGLSVVVDRDQQVPDNYRAAFDEVIGVDCTPPDAVDLEWRVENFAKLYDCSPYDETVTLDADMLFFDDVSSWWPQLAGQDIVAGRAVNYRGELIRDNPLRKDLYAIGLPDLHNGFLYFRRCPKVARLFGVMQSNIADWPNTLLRHYGTSAGIFSSDKALLLALRDCGMEEEAESRLGLIPRFVHMKACLQGWPGVGPENSDWRPFVSHSFDDDLNLHIDGQKIGDPFHYNVRNFVDDELLGRLEAG
jgi:hypothetical protein